MSQQPDEYFGLSWPGKAAAYASAAKAATMRLTWTEDVPASAEHTFISGDNLEALKLLLPQYEGKIKLIFIDPPYNTGSDRFIYRDDFSTGADRHAAWLSMMLPRLVLARKLLREDGVIF